MVQPVQDGERDEGSVPRGGGRRTNGQELIDTLVGPRVHRSRAS